MTSAISFVYIKIPPDEIGLFWPRMNMSIFDAHSVDTTKKRGAHLLLIEICNNGSRSFSVGENVVMNGKFGGF